MTREKWDELHDFKYVEWCYVMRYCDGSGGRNIRPGYDDEECPRCGHRPPAQAEPTAWEVLYLESGRGDGCSKITDCASAGCPYLKGPVQCSVHARENPLQVRWPSGKVGDGKPEFRTKPEHYDHKAHEWVAHPAEMTHEAMLTAVKTLREIASRTSHTWIVPPSPIEIVDEHGDKWEASAEGQSMHIDGDGVRIEFNIRRRIVGEYGQNNADGVTGRRSLCCDEFLPGQLVAAIVAGAAACPACGHDARRCQVGADKGHRCNRLLYKHYDHQTGAEFMACDGGHRKEES